MSAVAKQKVLVSMAGLATVVAWAWLYVFFSSRPPGVDWRAHRALGLVLAEEAIKQMSPGSRVLVIARDPQTFPMPAAEAQVGAFLEALKNARKTEVILRNVKIDPLRVVGVASGEYADLLRQCKESDVIVSFLGPPVLEREQLAKLGAKRPRLLAVCAGAMPARINLKTVFDQKLVQVAVISRADAAGKVAGNARAVFDQQFKLITSENVADVSATAVASQGGAHD